MYAHAWNSMKNVEVKYLFRVYTFIIMINSYTHGVAKRTLKKKK